MDEEVENAEIVMTTLNGLPRSWDSFIQGICGIRKLDTFSRLWEECSQEEARIVAQEENMGNEDQALTVDTKKNKRDHHHDRGKHSHQNNPRRDLSSIRCFTCDEKGHISRNYPRNKGGSQKKKNYKRIHHAHVAEDDDPSKKRVKQESEDSSSNEEYIFSSLTRTVTHGSNDWIIDSGASKHMMEFKEYFVKLFKHESTHKVKLGDY